MIFIDPPEETLPILSPETEKGSSSLSELSVHFEENYQLFRNIVKSLGKSKSIPNCCKTQGLDEDSVFWCSTSVKLYVLA